MRQEDALLMIDGIALALTESVELSQSYTMLRGGVDHEMADGSTVSQCFWRKYQTELSGEARLPPGLDQLRHGVEYELACVGKLTVASVSPVIALPTAARSDVDMVASTLLTGSLTPTTIADVTGSVVTLTEVPGAQSYRISYLPLLTVKLVYLNNNGDQRQARWGWSITFREV